MTEELEYRLAKRNNLYYPQVRIKKIFIWGNWQKIGVHLDGFGLYDESDYTYGTSREEAEKVVENFREWYRNQNGPVEYINLKNNEKDN